MIYPWNENIPKLIKIWSFLSFSQIFLRRKFFFSCGECIDFMLKGKYLLEYTNLFSPNDYEKKW